VCSVQSTTATSSAAVDCCRTASDVPRMAPLTAETYRPHTKCLTFVDDFNYRSRENYECLIAMFIYSYDRKCHLELYVRVIALYSHAHVVHGSRLLECGNIAETMHEEQKIVRTSRGRFIDLTDLNFTPAAQVGRTPSSAGPQCLRREVLY